MKTVQESPLGPALRSDGRCTRICAVAADGEQLSLLDGSNWEVVGLSSFISRGWRVGDQVVPAYDEIHHYRSNTRIHARCTTRAGAAVAPAPVRRRTA